MTRALLFAALGLLWASSEASAHCYAIWRYPWKQHCSPRSAPVAPDTSYYVEITKLPPAWERELGLEELKRLLH